MLLNRKPSTNFIQPTFCCYTFSHVTATVVEYFEDLLLCIIPRHYIVTCFSDYRRGTDWELDLLTPYAISLCLQAIQRCR
jgi:hypothetical protein